MSLGDGDRAIRQGAALGAVAPRRQLAVTGADRRTFLHGLLTNEVESLAPGSGCYAAWLTPQGRMITDLHLFELGEMVLLDVPAEQADALRERLDLLIFSEDVRVEALDGRLTAVWVHGPAAPAAVAASVDGIETPERWPDYRVSHARLGETAVFVARIDQLGVPGYVIYVPPGEEPALRAALRQAGAVEVSPQSIEAARIEAGYPVFGIDMTDDTIPLEAGIEDRAISFTKGCYVGQEVIIRVLHRGHGRVARRLVKLRFRDGVPARGARLATPEREVGFVTSAVALSGGDAIGLGYVHRDFVESGTALDVHDGDRRIPATVTGAAALRPASA